jgi:hypothetical protein
MLGTQKRSLFSACVFEWHKRFFERRDNLKDEQPHQPATMKPDENMAKVMVLVTTDHCLHIKIHILTKLMKKNLKEKNWICAAAVGFCTKTMYQWTK